MRDATHAAAFAHAALAQAESGQRARSPRTTEPHFPLWHARHAPGGRTDVTIRRPPPSGSSPGTGRRCTGRRASQTERAARPVLLADGQWPTDRPLVAVDIEIEWRPVRPTCWRPLRSADRAVSRWLTAGLVAVIVVVLAVCRDVAVSAAGGPGADGPGRASARNGAAAYISTGRRHPSQESHATDSANFECHVGRRIGEMLADGADLTLLAQPTYVALPGAGPHLLRISPAITITARDASGTGDETCRPRRRLTFRQLGRGDGRRVPAGRRRLAIRVRSGHRQGQALVVQPATPGTYAVFARVSAGLGAATRRAWRPWPSTPPGSCWTTWRHVSLEIPGQHCRKRAKVAAYLAAGAVVGASVTRARGGGRDDEDHRGDRRAGYEGQRVRLRPPRN